MTARKIQRDISGHTPFRIVATWPIGTFLENIAVQRDGQILVTALGEGVVYRVTPEGQSTVVAKLAHQVTGIVVRGLETFVCAGTVGKTPWTVFHIDPAGTPTSLVEIPNALLLNGFTRFRGSSSLVVDSYLGTIFEVDLKSGNYRTWLTHELLAKSTDRKSVPGVNGIKCFGTDVFVTNTDGARVIKVGQRNGLADSVEIVEQGLVGDDFAIDRDGSLYIATHSGNGLMKLSRTGERTLLAGPHQGMAGSTACAFGRAPGDEKGLYVTTTGGIFSPFEGRVQAAKLVRLETDFETKS